MKKSNRKDNKQRRDLRAALLAELAEAAIPITDNESHWEKSARALVMAMMMTSPYPVLVIDPKGEAAALHRKLTDDEKVESG